MIFTQKQFTIAALALLMAIATEASPVVPYTAGVVAYDNAWPVATTGAAWSPYWSGNAHYGYGAWPAYGKSYGYSNAWAPTVVSTTKVVDGGLWNYAPYGHGYGHGYGYGLGYSKYW